VTVGRRPPTTAPGLRADPQIPSEGRRETAMNRTVNRTGPRAGLTLIELLVVVAILAIVVGLVIPRLNGVTIQASTATNANILSDVNRAVGVYETRYKELPNVFDYLLNQDGTTLFTNLNPKVINETLPDGTTRPRFRTGVLSDLQAQSLVQAGITGGHLNNEAFAGLPSNSQRGFRPINNTRTVVFLQKHSPFGGHGVDWLDRAFAINQFKPDVWADEYVVFGLAGPTSLKGTTMQEVPVVESADPSRYYAHVMCVFRVPGAGRPFFKAQYVGSFCPDGSSIRDNLDNYATADVPLSTP
jgi:prepilin-type N-terminal cleavage/methylation domain-containing protein